MQRPYRYTKSGSAYNQTCDSVYYRDRQLDSEDIKGVVGVECATCPNCGRPVITLVNSEGIERMIWPSSGLRKPYQNVPKEILKDFVEAAEVLPISANASAALARRCLQSLLVKQGAKEKNLAKQIKEKKGEFPSYIIDLVDKIRELGNLAAHAAQHNITAEIIDVEYGEADWLLELLGELFEFYYEKPAAAELKRQQVEVKLKDKTRLKV